MNRISTVIIAISAGWVLAAGTQAVAYEEIEVTDGGSVSGKVMLGSAQPEVQTYNISKDPEVCGTGSRDVEWVRGNGDALLDAVVYLEEVEAGKAYSAEANELKVDQTECRYTPYVGVVANGGTLNVVNSDATLHNVHTYELIKKVRRTVINVSQPESSDPVSKTIKLRRGVAMKVECDVHDFMHSWVFAARNPYYAIVNENGEFTIDGIPPGTYVVKSWHGRLGEQETTVEIAAGGTVEASFSY